MRPKPILVRVLAALLAILALVSGAWGVIAEAWGQALFGVIGLAGAIGLYSPDPRSRYVVYVSSTLIIGSWLLVVAMVAASGWPYSDALSSVVSLIPGLLLVLLCGSASLYVARHFRGSV